ncbi:MAG: glycosyltransferase family 61 protein [Deltaproteobacteria bacterium]|nr:glycosyltransferase family 61 protein [Deltaproteobacteria bacterium]
MDDVAERWRVHPEEVQEVPAPFFFPEHLERIAGFGPLTDRQFQMNVIERRLVHHDATLAYRLRGALVQNGFVYSQGLSHAFTFRRRPWVGGVPERELDEAALVTEALSTKWFGDFLFNECSAGLLAQEQVDTLIREEALSRHGLEYAQIFGLRYEAVRAAYVHELMLVRDIGMNANRRARLRRMREMVQAAFPLSDPKKVPRGVFIVRGRSGSARILRNEPELVEAMSARGIAHVTSDEPLDALLPQCMGAQLVISVDGSQQNHGLMAMREGGFLLSLQPPDRVNLDTKIRTDALGFGYGFLIGEGSSSGFRIELEDILRLLARAGYAL